MTLVARRDTASQWGVWLAQNVPAALLDPLIYDLFDETRGALDQRAQTDQPFGVPLLPTATPAPAISPSPGSLIGEPAIVNTPAPTRPAGGFITQTPTPNGLAPIAQPHAASRPTTANLPHAGFADRGIN